MGLSDHVDVKGCMNLFDYLNKSVLENIIWNILLTFKTKHIFCAFMSSFVAIYLKIGEA